MLRPNIVSLPVPVLLVTVLLITGVDRGHAEPVSLKNVQAKEEVAAQMPEVTDAMAKFQQRDYAAALKLLEAAKKKNDTLAPPQMIMAQFASSARQAALVQQWLDRAAQAHPDDPQAYVAMAELALQGRRITSADLLFTKAAALLGKFKGPEKRKTQLQQSVAGGLAAVAETRKDWPVAQTQLETVLAVNPKNINALRRMAMVLCQQGNQDAALAKLKEAAKIDKDFLTPEAVLAQDCQRMGDRDSSTKWMIAALKNNPKDFRTRMAAARWAFQTEQFDQAMEQAAFAAKLDPNSLDAKMLEGNAAIFLKDYAKASELLEQTMIHMPGNFSIVNNLALALCEQDDPAKQKLALQYAQVNARLYPRQAETASTLGWVYYKLGQLDKAEQTLRIAASRGNLSPDTAYYIARVSADKGNNKEARALLQQALAIKGLFSQRAEAQALLQQLSK